MSGRNLRPRRPQAVPPNSTRGFGEELKRVISRFGDSGLSLMESLESANLFLSTYDTAGYVRDRGKLETFEHVLQSQKWKALFDFTGWLHGMNEGLCE